jgi:hypothetical protein
MIHYTSTMVFNLLDFNKQFSYYWWLNTSRPSRYWKIGWGEDKQTRTTTAKSRWPSSTPPEGVEIMDPRDYPEYPPLNRHCSEENIHQTIIAEYDTAWPRFDYVELYFRVYQSVTNRIIRKIVRKGLVDANNATYDEENIVNTLISFLPSGLPIDEDGMQLISNKLHESRKKKRISDEAKVEKEKERMELTRCLICRAIELLLQTSETNDAELDNTDRKKIYTNTENGKRRGVLLSRSHRDEAWKNRIESVKFIYFKVQEFE